MRRVTIQLAVLAIAIAPLATANAYTKCQRGNKVLYTQELHCPTGHTAVATAVSGTVSTVGKSDAIRKQEQDFLVSRATNAPATAHIVSSTAPVQASYGPACEALTEQARAIEASMRRPGDAQWHDSLRQQHRSVRDQQHRLGC
ncbi:hypothetical protein [Cupriavidus sp. SW-Y-13]|uniref:hypothetical protein n=1 Tax=Cupriavidus sp. SW-Y-13 TaxID=2653854 RepID=UPI001365DD9A|nr:hypothetical protein [Cupriavidus sp. SW-Y-13]MWL91346.1 hypothetical protein [Cupriavidus sp. SW-Y-13]